MNSSAANMNISALLNLGVKTKPEARDIEPRESDDDFKRHMSNEVSSAKETSASADTHSRNSKQDSDDKGQRAIDQVETKSGNASGAEDDSETVQKQVEPDSSVVEPEPKNDSAMSPAGDSNRVQAVDSSQPESVDTHSPLIAPMIDDLSPHASGEVIIDVPADASISLERLADAVTNGGAPQLQTGEASNTALDELVDDITPIDTAIVAPAVATPAVQSSSEAGVTASAAVGANAGAAVRQTLASVQPNTESEITEEGEGFTSAADIKSVGMDAKPVANKTVELVQLADNMPRPNQQTLNQQVASAVNGVTQELVKDGAAKSDSSSSIRDASPLVATTQRPASRPINIQQGNAQFTMPNQAKAGQPQWQTAVAERVAIMATQRLTSAEIQLDPPELGQLQVRVTLNQEQASVSFASQHAVVREALDQTAQKLRDMFDAEGLNLVDVDVSDQSFQQQGEAGNGGSGQGDTNGENDGIAEEPVQVKIAQGLVDQFV